MNDRELNQRLKSVPVPVQPPEYWRDFPGEVRRKINARAGDQPRPLEAATASGPGWRWLALAGAAALAVAAFLATSRRADDGFSRRELADYAEVWRELSTLFPHQVRSVVFRPEGPELVLAEQPNLPTEPTLVVRGCSERGCTTALTRSGQAVVLGGKRLEILEDAAGEVLVTGDSTVWPGASGALRISARVLKGNL